MARKNSEAAGTLPGMDDAPAPRPRVRVSQAPLPKKAREISAWRIAGIVTSLAIVLLAALYSLHRLEQFLIRDERFALGGADAETPTLQIIGITHASRRAVESVFNEDTGRSIYLLPLADRRETLRTVDWVKDASIARVWPNQVEVRVTERSPVAFVAISASRFGLIDEDGVILPPVQDRFTLPVLAGVKPSQPISDRKQRVHRMLRLTRDLGKQTAQISEIDVSDPDNLKVAQQWEGQMVTLLLGDHNYSLRYQNFFRYYPVIKQRLPGATTLDMRLEDRITAVE
jgi:cell division protein FtsQ